MRVRFAISAVEFLVASCTRSCGVRWESKKALCETGCSGGDRGLGVLVMGLSETRRASKASFDERAGS